MLAGHDPASGVYGLTVTPTSLAKVFSEHPTFTVSACCNTKADASAELMDAREDSTAESAFDLTSEAAETAMLPAAAAFEAALLAAVMAASA